MPGPSFFSRKLAASSALCLRLMKKVGERLKKQQEKENNNEEIKS